MILFPTRRHVRILAPAFAAIWIVACGGGGGGAVADISGSGVVSGPVTGFGSVIVNGVEMNTDQALLTNDGQTISQADLKVGDTVTMRGTFNGSTGTAQTLIADEMVKGPVESVDVGTSSFVAMGQTVRVTLGTAFEGVTLDTLAPGDLVAVNGSLDANDQIRATRVEVTAIPAGTDYEVSGYVDAVNAATSQLTINGLTVDYSTATVTTEQSAPLAAGMYVNVGAGSAPVASVLLASSVIQEQRVPGIEVGDEGEIEGIVTQILSSTRFIMNGIIVQHDGSLAVALNDNIEVEGTFDAAGVLQARDLEVETEPNIRIDAPVDAVDAGNSRITVLGKTFTANSLTEFEDQQSNIEQFRLSDILPGDYVEVSAYAEGSGALIATRIERDPAQTRIVVRGPVDGDPAASPFGILGISIATDGNTQFRNTDGSAMTAAAFYGAVGTNDVVRIRQDSLTQPIVADEAALKQDN